MAAFAASRCPAFHLTGSAGFCFACIPAGHSSLSGEPPGALGAFQFKHDPKHDLERVFLRDLGEASAAPAFFGIHTLKRLS
jgi:hypothetical protein